MKTGTVTSHRFQTSAGELLLALATLLCASANAQNLLKNGNFESPLPIADPTNGWAVVYVDGDPGDFGLAGQTTEASAGGGGRGAQFRANTWNGAHAYFKQVVTNLSEGSIYTLNIVKMRSAYPYTDAGSPPKQKVYASLISGSASNAVHGYSASNGPYSLSITCSASGLIEVQLHMSKTAMLADESDDFKSAKCVAWFDEFSLTLAP